MIDSIVITSVDWRIKYYPSSDKPDDRHICKNRCKIDICIKKGRSCDLPFDIFIVTVK